MGELPRGPSLVPGQSNSPLRQSVSQSRSFRQKSLLKAWIQMREPPSSGSIIVTRFHDQVGTASSPQAIGVDALDRSGRGTLYNDTECGFGAYHYLSPLKRVGGVQRGSVIEQASIRAGAN